MSRHAQRSTKSSTRTVAAAAFAIAGLAVTGAGVYAGLNATASDTQSVDSGTLKLALGNESGSTFSGAVSNLAPGDVVNRYVTLTNNGTLAALTLKLGVTGTGSLLSTSASKGLALTITTCSTSWTTATATCSSGGTTAVVMNSIPVSTLTTPGTLAAGLAVNEVAHLKMSLTLPDQTETTTNGLLPGSTIQGLSDTLTYTFSEVQRAATVTNS